MDVWTEKIIGWLVGGISFIFATLLTWGVHRIHRLEVEKATRDELKELTHGMNREWKDLDKRLRELTEKVATKDDMKDVRNALKDGIADIKTSVDNDMNSINSTLKDFLMLTVKRDRPP